MSGKKLALVYVEDLQNITNREGMSKDWIAGVQDSLSLLKVIGTESEALDIMAEAIGDMDVEIGDCYDKVAHLRFAKAALESIK